MQLQLLIHFAVHAALLLHSAASSDDFPSEEMNEVERIVGGQNAEDGEYQSAVAMYYNNHFICGSSIISPNCILTAAHCIQHENDTSPVPADLLYGVANVNKSASHTKIYFNNCTVHPDYNKTGNLENDIAICKTSEPIPFSDEVNQTCIPSKNASCEKTFLTGTAVGWSNTSLSNDPPNLSDILQEVNQSITIRAECNVARQLSERQLCAKGMYDLENNRLAGLSNGDSGGPLFQNDDKMDVECLIKNNMMTQDPSFGRSDNRKCQIGMASQISSWKGDMFVFSVYTRLSQYRDFIDEHCNDTCSCVEWKIKEILDKTKETTSLPIIESIKPQIIQTVKPKIVVGRKRRPFK